MDTRNEKKLEEKLTDTTLRSSGEKFGFGLKLTTQLLCQALLWSQILMGPMSLAQDSNSSPAPTPNYDAQRSANQDHLDAAELNGGLHNTCDAAGAETIYDQLQSLNQQSISYSEQSAAAINNRISELRNSNEDLIAQQTAFMLQDGSFAGTSSGTPAQQEAYASAQEDFIEKSNAKTAAKDAYNAARSACSPMTCTPAQTNTINQTYSAYQAASSAYSASYQQYKDARDAIQGGTLDTINDVEDPYFAKEKRYEDAQVALGIAQDNKLISEAEYAAAQSACSSFCTSAQQQRINQAHSNRDAAVAALAAATTEYNVARNEFRNAPRGMAASAQDASDATAGNANSMAGSHAISGCGSNFDITTNTDTDCELTGPLFQADEELTRIANQNIDTARLMAARRADMLFDLELQQKYAADYQLYELAVNGAYIDQGYANLEEAANSGKVKSAALAISNIKAIGAASSAVKDMVCEQHDVSEVDSKSYYILRAATATWLMAVVNDTDYYTGKSACYAKDVLSGDENNQQIYSVERAANLSQQQLESLCMRIEPKTPQELFNEIYTDPPVTYNPTNSDHWKYFGTSADDAAWAVGIINGYTDEDGVTYPPLKERCMEYYQKIRGADYADKPATREYARDMVVEALGLAMEELGAKRQKIATAHAQVVKGEKWVERVKRDLMIMGALAAVIYVAYTKAAKACAGCGPGCSSCCTMCPVASKLNSKYVYITGTVIAVWLMSELMRAQSFLAKWRAKLHQAKYFHHMACNFEDAKAEEVEMQEMGRIAQEKKAEELERATNEANSQINREVFRGVTSPDPAPVPDSPSTFVLPSKIKQLNELLEVKTREPDVLQTIANAFNIKSVSNIKELNKKLSHLGLALMTEIIPKAHAEDPPVVADTRENRRDQQRTANALNIAEGTESFRYFLVNRNKMFQVFTNDITNQPEHTRADSEIDNAGSGITKNVDGAGAIIKSVDELAAPFMGGGGNDPIADLTPEQKTGFATPETRVATIQMLLDIFNENLMRLNGGLVDVTWQRDQTVQLLNNMRKTMSIDKQGLGETQLIPGGAPKPTCMAGDLENLNFDATCGCSQGGGCTAFEYPTFDIVTPEALKNGSRLSIDTANSVMAGNLDGAALTGGQLANNAANLRKTLFDSKNKVNNQRKEAGLPPRDFASEGKSLINATERNISRSLADQGVYNPNSLLSRTRNGLFDSGLDTDKNTKGELGKNGGQNSLASSRTGKRGGLGKTNANKKKAIGSESFSLGASNVNLNLEGLTDEERRRLGLGGVSGNGASSENESGDNRYGHIRQTSGKQGSSLDPNDPYAGINKNRKRSLFGIISKRYEKTAFPVLLNIK